MPNPAETARILDRLRRLRIETDREGAFRSHFDRLLARDEGGALLPMPQRFSDGRETRGMMVIDGPGGGKTTLVSRALKHHPAVGESAPGGPHFIEASVPSPASLKSMGHVLLERSGYPVVDSNHNARSTWETVARRFKDLGITTLCIDEAHDLFCADKDLILRSIKSLMQGDDAFVIVLTGTEKLRDIVRSDPQLQRRFSTLILPPVALVTDGPRFVEVIAEYCRFAGLAPPIEPDLVPRLFHAARYRFGRCVETVIGAIELALNADAPRLDVDHFAWFWAMQEGCALGENVFVARDWSQIDPDRNEEEEARQRPRARRRQK